jgi:hypothetical protein
MGARCAWCNSHCVRCLSRGARSHTLLVDRVYRAEGVFVVLGERRKPAEPYQSTMMMRAV